MEKGKNPLVSVVITTYGRTDTLSRAIKSVLNQTYKNIEIIIVDDNADSKRAIKIDKEVFDFKDGRIHVIHNTKNLGGALARNVGIDASHGTFIAFLDDDDQFLPKKIEKQLNLFLMSKDKNLALVYCWDIAIGDEGKVLYRHKGDIIGNCIFEGMYDCIAATSLWLCKKEALNKVGNFTDTPCKQDSFVIVKLLVHGYSVDRIPEFLAIYDDGNHSRISTQGHEKRIIGEEKLFDYCKQNYDKLNDEEKNDVEYAFATRLLEHYLGTGRYKKAWKCLKKVVTRHPLRRMSLGCYKRCLKILIKRN